jgi:outer membrane protein OmpU
MKKFLLGSTALVAVGVIAGGAQAADGVGGYFNSAYGYVNENNGKNDAGYQHKSDSLNMDDEIHFKGETTLDNGLTVGGRVELEGFQSSDQIDERWMYFRGGFGELRYGDEDDSRKLKSYAAPTPTPNTFGVNSPFFTFNNVSQQQVASSVSTFRNLDNDAAKLIYFTPSFGGFQLVVSYAPDGQQDRTGFGTGSTQVPCAATTGGQSSGFMDDLSVGADYSGTFGSLTIGAGGGYSRGKAKCDTVEDASVWAAGINIGFAGFTVGGSILMGNDLPVNSNDLHSNTEFDVGVTYALDAVTVGAGWGHGKYDRAGGLGDDTLDQAQIGASYALGPGISVDAMVGVFNYDCKSCSNAKGFQTGIGTAIAF